MNIFAMLKIHDTYFNYMFVEDIVKILNNKPIVKILNILNCNH